jgi:hypothetical protein
MIDMRKESDNLGVGWDVIDIDLGKAGTEIFLQMGLDNKQLAADLRETHGLCDEHGDVASAAYWKTRSTRPSGARGSCSRPRA